MNTYSGSIIIQFIQFVPSSISICTIPPYESSVYYDSGSVTLRRFAGGSTSASAVGLDSLSPTLNLVLVGLAAADGFDFFLTSTPFKAFLVSFLAMVDVTVVGLVLLGAAGSTSDTIGGGFAAFSRAATALRE